jgi:predicted DNA-binding protein (MmcQ/YjbR family)
MRLHALRRFALSLPQTTATLQWGNNLVFKVAGKMFMIISLDAEVIEAVGFKCSPADFERLTDCDGIIPAPYLARASWVQVQDLAALSAPELEAQIRASYDLVCAGLPKGVRTKLGL